MSKDDQQLIEECLSGQTEAFDQLVVRYQDRLFNALLRVLGSSEDARDAAQDAFVHAFQKLNTFRGSAAFYSWLFRIAMNTAVSQMRKTRRMKASVEAARETTGVEPVDVHPATRPSHALELSENQERVNRALAELPEEYRAVLVLKEIEGMKYEQIAEIVDCPIGTVRSRIHRARSELRKKLLSFFQE